MKKKFEQSVFTTLPEKIVAEIKSLELTNIQEKKCYHLISIIRNKSKRENSNFYSFVELPSAYLKKVFTEKYRYTIDLLLEKEIILCDNVFYFGGESKSLCYKVNDKYCGLECSVSISYNRVLLDINPSYTKDRRVFIDDIEQLKINIDKLIELMNEKVNSISISDFKTNELIPEDSLRVILKKNNYEKRYETSTSNALNTAREHNVSLIQDKRNYYIMDEQEFIAMKKDYILSSYTDSIKKFEKKYWYAAKNSTNGRLDSNITNLCSQLMDEIIESNDLVQLDLSNSQFSILSHIIPIDVVGDDVERFKELSYSGELYDYIKDILSLDSRKQAKQVTFELLFSSHKTRSKKLSLLKGFFPNVIAWINNYKKENGSEQFAIMLQKKESEMFIDHIWKSLKKKKFFALTKHDCIICKKEDEVEIRNFIQLYFDSIGFRGIIK